MILCVQDVRVGSHGICLVADLGRLERGGMSRNTKGNQDVYVCV